ncbi:MAG TPA: alpha/beta fold hydrolase [Acidimicrobiales bacterium]
MDGHRLKTSDGIELLARHWPATAPVRGAAVVAHGFSASKDAPGVVAVAKRLAAMGLDVIGYDARGHGDSEGICTLGDHERHDVAAAVDAARRRAPNVVLVGASMGAIAVLRHAANAQDVTGIVSVSSPARWRIPRTPRAIAAAGLTQTALGRWIAARRLGVRLATEWTRPEPPVSLVRRITVPLAIVHGAADRFIRVNEARELARAAGARSKLLVVPGMGHAYDRYAVPAIAEAVEWVLSLNGPTTISRHHAASTDGDAAVRS